MSDEDTVPLRLVGEDFDGSEDGLIDLEVSRPLAERIDSLRRRTGRSLGDIWLFGLRRFGDEVAVRNAPELYEECETGRDAQEEWVRLVFERTADALEADAPNRHMVGDEELM